MLNRLLQLLTARQKGFVSPLFQTPGGYAIPPSSDHERFLREFLCLHKEGTDYYVQGVLAALTAYPELMEGLPTVHTWAPGDYRPTLVATQNGNFVPDRTGEVGIFYHPARLPASTELTLTYLGSSSGRLVMGTDRYALTVRVVTRGVFQYLYADWPAESGIRGGIRLDEGLSWEPEYTFSAEFFPASYPYEWVAETAVTHVAAQDVLQHARLLEGYHADPCPVRRVAMLGAALIRDAEFHIAKTPFDVEHESPFCNLTFSPSGASVYGAPLLVEITCADVDAIPLAAGGDDGPIYGGSVYLRPDGESVYLRPDGESVYLRPEEVEEV